MAERSTAAVGVAETSGAHDAPLTAQQDGATGDGATDATNGYSRNTGTSDHDESPAHSTDTAPLTGTRGATRPAASPEGSSGNQPNSAGEEPAPSNRADADDAAGARGGDTSAAAPERATDTQARAEAGPDADAASDAGTETGAGTASGSGDDSATDGAAADAGSAEEKDAGQRAGQQRPRKKAKDRKEPRADRRQPEAPAGEQLGAASDPADGSAKPAPAEMRVPELHSGHKLARRYRLEECVTRLDGFSSWRAVDEKLRRAVGVHVLPVGHARARQVLAAARSAALLGDPRFVQVLDAVEEGELVYVVHEWLPDAVPLSELLAAGPLEPHEAYQLVNQLAQALAAAHREGLAHLRLTPSCVLRTGMGQYRIRGLAVNAALRGVTSEHPQRDDTEAIGALLYAALTQRWPYEEGAHGLPGTGSLDIGALVAPEQLRAGVHRGLSTLAMRALVNDGATASRQEQPCTNPDELCKAVASLPRIRPPEQAFTTPPPYQRTAYQQGSFAAPGVPGGAAPGSPAAVAGAEPPAPPTLPGRTGKALKWGVSALLIAALGLGSWQIADALLKGEPVKEKPTKPVEGEDKPVQTGKPIKIQEVQDFDPESSDGREKPERAGDAVDGDPGTYWLTDKYLGHPTFGNLKSGAGLILDLGTTRQVSQLKVDFIGKTSASFLAAPKSVTNTPSSLGSFSKVTNGSGEHLTLKAKKPIKTRYVLLWLTKLPATDGGDYRGRVTEVQVLS
ncbi:hypothetical protein AB0939_16500 [Streptomyces sp. NPDC006990]|uniref:protein kinase family protein n=1 Tax=Streptomyces sp. NPDC006990 TaxID=3154481 RepID=UPI00345509EC